MAPGDPYFEFFTKNAAGPVPPFEVDDVHQARAELVGVGVEIAGEMGRGQPLRVAALASTGWKPLRVGQSPTQCRLPTAADLISFAVDVVPSLVCAGVA